jgi:hypothetical protein
MRKITLKKMIMTLVIFVALLGLNMLFINLSAEADSTNASALQPYNTIKYRRLI